MTVTLDHIDRKILTLLQRDARMTNAAIGAEVNLTAPSVFERIRKLEQRNVIQRYTVVLDPAALGKTITAFIRFTVAYDEKHDSGIEALSCDPEVLELYCVAGEDCFVIKTRVSNAEALQALINRIRTQVNVLRSVTMIALGAIKENAPIEVMESAPDLASASGTHTRQTRA